MEREEILLYQDSSMKYTITEDAYILRYYYVNSWQLNETAHVADASDIVAPVHKAESPIQALFLAVDYGIYPEFYEKLRNREKERKLEYVLSYLQEACE